jgi:hypothetical protein
MTPFALRRTARLLHLSAAVLIGWSVYGSLDAIDQIVAWIVFPALSTSGLTMWFAPQVLRRMRRVPA